MRKSSLWWKSAVVVALFAAIIAAEKAKNMRATTPTTTSTVTEVPAEEAAAHTRLPRLLELGSTECVPCQMMEPVLKELHAEYAGKLTVEFVDIWKNPDVGKQYGVHSIPTQIFFDADGKEIYRHLGFFPKEDIIAKFTECNVKL